MSDADVARKAEAALGFDAAVSAASAAAPSFVAAALVPHVAHALVLDDMLLVFQHCDAPAGWHGCKPEQLHAQSGVRPMLRCEASQNSFHALGGEETLEQGDRVIAMTCLPLEPASGAARPQPSGVSSAG